MEQTFDTTISPATPEEKLVALRRQAEAKGRSFDERAVRASLGLPEASAPEASPAPEAEVTPEAKPARHAPKAAPRPRSRSRVGSRK